MTREREVGVDRVVTVVTNESVELLLPVLRRAYVATKTGLANRRCRLPESTSRIGKRLNVKIVASRSAFIFAMTFIDREDNHFTWDPS